MPDYSFLTAKYPAYVTKDQLYRIAHISKATAKYYLDNGFIPCVSSTKKTRRYKIALKDIIFFLEDRDRSPEKYYLPKHFNNPFLPSKERQYRQKPRNGNFADSYKLKRWSEVKDYRHYLEQQFADYPDMMTKSQIRQITGRSIAVIDTWIKGGDVKYIYTHSTYFIQKKSVIRYLYDRETHLCSAQSHSYIMES